MIDEFTIFPCPFSRRVVGAQGHVLLRENSEHVRNAVRAIRRRAVPAWSSAADSYRVAA